MIKVYLETRHYKNGSYSDPTSIEDWCEFDSAHHVDDYEHRANLDDLTEEEAEKERHIGCTIKWLRGEGAYVAEDAYRGDKSLFRCEDEPLAKRGDDAPSKDEVFILECDESVKNYIMKKVGARC